MFKFTRFLGQSLCFASNRRFLLILMMVAPMVFMASSSSVSGALVDSWGFESPSFAIGDLEGQGNLAGQAAWVKLTSGSGAGSGTAWVQTAIKESGSQAVSVSRIANVDNRWAVPVPSFAPLPKRIIQIDWDMYVNEADSNDSWGPFMGMEAYDGSATLGLLGSLGVDASSQDVLYQIENTGVLTETGTTVAFDTWYHFQIRLNFDTNNYAAFVDGNMVASTGFVDGTGLSKFTDADIAALAAGGDGSSQSATTTAYFDNFLVSEVNGADFDGDGDVDGTDLLVWQRGYGISGTALPSDGDANGDRDVDALDLTIWQEEFGFVASATIVATAVPEPASLVLFILGGFLVLSPKRRRA
jgi:hypothetical protein